MRRGQAYEKLHYTWEVDRISHHILEPRGKRNKQDIKQAIDFIKKVIRKERDPEVTRKLAVAGIELNYLLVK